MGRLILIISRTTRKYWNYVLFWSEACFSAFIVLSTPVTSRLTQIYIPKLDVAALQFSLNWRVTWVLIVFLWLKLWVCPTCLALQMLLSQPQWEKRTLLPFSSVFLLVSARKSLFPVNRIFCNIVYEYYIKVNDFVILFCHNPFIFSRNSGRHTGTSSEVILVGDGIRDKSPNPKWGCFTSP